MSEDFGKLFEESTSRAAKHVATGDKVTGTVTSITKNSVFVDLGMIIDGVIDRKDLLNEKGEVRVKEGDKVTAFCMGVSDEGVKLQVRISADAMDSSIADAYEAHIPIEGKVIEARKGGFAVEIANTRAFCPFSQIDARGVKKEPEEYIGQSFNFIITEFSEEERNVVLSRRRILDEEAQKMREYLKSMLNVGDVREGTVVKVMPFGAFVDLGGIQGLVPVSEIGWTRGVKAEEAVSVGQAVTVKIIALEWGDGETKERVTLSMKQATKSPWEQIADGESRYVVGMKMTGRVARLADFGVFVELEPGVDGLAHISQLGQESRVEKPSEVCQVGDEVEVTILGIDGDKRRISLCFGDPKVKDEKPAELAHEQEVEIERATMGERVVGEVERVQPFGVFVKLPNGQTGLLHVSQTGIEESGPNRSRALYSRYPLHSQVEVIVKEVNGNRISLTTPDVVEREIEANTVNNFTDEAGTGFGNLDDVFGGLKF